MSLNVNTTFETTLNNFNLSTIGFFALKLFMTVCLQLALNQTSQYSYKSVISITAKRYFKDVLLVLMAETFLTTILSTGAISKLFSIFLEIVLGVLFSYIYKPNFNKSEITKLLQNLCIKKTVKFFLVCFVMNDTVVDPSSKVNIYSFVTNTEFSLVNKILKKLVKRFYKIALAVFGNVVIFVMLESFANFTETENKDKKSFIERLSLAKNMVKITKSTGKKKLFKLGMMANIGDFLHKEVLDLSKSMF